MNPFENLLTELNNHNLWKREITLKRNDFLVRKGDIDTHIYFVINGSLRIFFYDEFEERVIRLAYKNNLVTCLDSFISEKPSELYIQAIKKTTLKSIDKVTLESFITNKEKRQKMWSESLLMLILQQLEREKDILTSSPVERYNRVIKRSPQLFQEIPAKHIASYLRMTPETFSRIKKS